ncbi:Pycsar system effector family protein [Kaistella jeonii]|uniref:Phosphohydrolase n=1 Tax=Kaistella jeonii TaxID=266749 RepID=A0A0C1F8I4_9FLAO|nr:Pycsar system effector family protein [Kaistella jeonii]KIA88198.1 phosphohydrolase [Kaistella jeonii]SFC25643.1 Predicted metal-dependent phosphohydrolase, HD superfamily [Kaistella jeonii]VEI95661.1 Uncharacterized protein conserved in bacteria [Kaistella jeonii]
MSLLKEAENYILQLFKDKLSPSYHYHNLGHTQAAVQHAAEIMKSEDIGSLLQEQILIALWFHDAGYIDGEANGHEERSAQLATDFLEQKGQSSEYIEQIQKLILVTKMEVAPSNLAEKIIRDADFSHVGQQNYVQISNELRKEWSGKIGKSYTDKEWYKENLNFLKNKHHFFSEYAQKNWQPQKNENIREMEEKLSNLKKNEDKKSKKEKKSKNNSDNSIIKTDRSFDTMFRVTMNNHTRLSDIADSKANILLSVNAIIISICLSTLIPKLDAPSNAHLIWPTFILLGFNVVSIIFAILSTRPKITKVKFSILDVQNRKVNILFFGNFNRLKLDEFIPAMWELYEDKKYLYETLVKDLYFLGKVLDRKYRLLNITYVIFMIGIIVSVFAFVWSFIKL